MPSISRTAAFLVLDPDDATSTELRFEVRGDATVANGGRAFVPPTELCGR